MFSQQKVLLDTHTWIWVNENSKKISSSFKTFIQKSQNSSSILLSPISFWEIGMLVEKGRLELSMDCLDWVREATKVSGLRIAPITPRIAILSSRLPDIHKDPADRLLIATAYERKAVFATSDEKLIEYCGKNSLAFIDPCKNK